MFNSMIFILLGLATLVLGAELVTRGATRLALALGVKPLVLGITVVAIGTSAPELSVGITATLKGSGGMAIGNIAGTNVLNILFILCLSALIKPLPLHTQIIKLELPVTLLASILMIGLAWDGILTQLDGAILCSIGLTYTVILIKISKDDSASGQNEKPNDPEEPFRLRAMLRWHRFARTKVGYIFQLVLGIGISILGATWLVDGASHLARMIGFSETMIGLTILAIGTSAPELATTILSTIRGDRDVAVGNLLGSSIYNILFILGITCLITPRGIVVEEELLHIDIPFMVLVIFGCWPVFVSGRMISRLEGALGIILYISYMYWFITLRGS